jgi:hypothetical protein
MSQSALIAIVAVVAVAMLGLLLRRISVSPPGPVTSAPASPPPGFDLDEADDLDDGGDPDEHVAVTSDGWAFVPVGDRDRVQLVPPRAPAEPVEGMGKAMPEHLARGDLIAARVVRGAPDHDPWRLEALGRDHEYRAWRFETEEAARAAETLVAARVVRIPRDPDGEPVPVRAAEFDEARKREEEIEAELAGPEVIDLDEPEPPEPLR